MDSLPPKPIFRAAIRWYDQLRHSSLERARAVFSTNPSYNDLTLTQYGAAFDWLCGLGVVDGEGRLSYRDEHVSRASVAEMLLEAAIEEAQPAWIHDADLIIDSVDELPADIIDATEALSLGASDGLAAVRAAWGKVDTAIRTEVGRIGEAALVRELRSINGAEVSHVALDADGYGYDVVLRYGSYRGNLEVKSTSRRGRLSFYMSRNEYQVMLRDPDWRLVVVLVGPSNDLAAVGSIPRSWICERSPSDATGEGRWWSARFDAAPNATHAGLTAAVPWALAGLPADHILVSGHLVGSRPEWL